MQAPKTVPTEPNKIRNFINGQFVEPVGGKYLENIDGLSFVELNVDASIGQAAARFVEEVAAVIATPVFLNAKQELAGEILSASYFDTSERSRFITLITAVEGVTRSAAKRVDRAGG